MTVMEAGSLVPMCQPLPTGDKRQGISCEEWKKSQDIWGNGNQSLSYRFQNKISLIDEMKIRFIGKKDMEKKTINHPVINTNQFSLIQLLSHVQLLVTPWTVARQASLSINNSQSLLKLMSIELVMDGIQPSHPLSSPPPPAFNLSVDVKNVIGSLYLFEERQ